MRIAMNVSRSIFVLLFRIVVSDIVLGESGIKLSLWTIANAENLVRLKRKLRQP